MEFKNCVACLLRALLTVTVLYGLNGRTAARSTAAPKDMDINTLVDDEDLQINQRKEGVSFFLELQSKVVRHWCDDKSALDVIMRQIRSRLLSDLNEECKCVETSVDIVSKEKMECHIRSYMHYYGEIQHWTSSEYSVQQVAQFLDSWRPLLIIEGSDIDFVTIPGFNFTFNVTNSQTTMVNEDVGSGGGVNIDDIMNLGSGEIGVLEGEIEPEQDKNFNSLTGGTQGVHIVGSIVSLITGVLLLLSFVCFI